MHSKVSQALILAILLLCAVKYYIMYKYFEIVKDDTNEVVSRCDVSNKSERQIDRIMFGASINLNHNEYSVRLTESKTELPVVR